jgi:hypothetical protein
MYFVHVCLYAWPLSLSSPLPSLGGEGRGAMGELLSVVKGYRRKTDKGDATVGRCVCCVCES